MNELNDSQFAQPHELVIISEERNTYVNKQTLTHSLKRTQARTYAHTYMHTHTPPPPHTHKLFGNFLDLGI